MHFERALTSTPRVFLVLSMWREMCALSISIPQTGFVELAINTDAVAPVMLKKRLSIRPLVIINDVSFASLEKVVMAENYKK